MHVLWIPSWYCSKEHPHTGIYYKEQAAALKRQGVEMGIVAPEVRPLKWLTLPLLIQNHFQTSHEVVDGIPTWRRHGWNLFPKLEKMQMEAWCYYASDLAERYRRNHGTPDLIHAHAAFWGGIAASRIAKAWGIPYCITEHNTSFCMGKVLTTPLADCWSFPYVHAAFNSASAVIAVSRHMEKALALYLDGTEKNAHVIPNSVDDRFFDLPIAARSGNHFRFLTVSNLVPIKNTAMVIRAFKQVQANTPESVLEIVGDGSERKKLELLVRELGLEKRVVFLGACPRDQVIAAYARADAFVHGSNHDSFSVVCAEALAAGLPVVGTRCGGPEDIVTPDVGILVPVGDTAAFAAAMAAVAQDPNHFDRRKIREIAEKKYRQDVVASQTLALYRKTK